MEAINHEYYVSLEVAKLLKYAGFKWGCRAAWDLTFPNEPYLNYAAVYPTDFNNDVDDILYAPTLDVAQRWLREVHHLHITIFSSSQESWMFRITKPHQKLENGVYREDFYTYEEAQEAGEKKALELI